jgi:hypothetical protein
MLMRTHSGAVDEHFFKIGISRHFCEDPMPDALPRPAGKALIGTIPFPTGYDERIHGC